MSSDPESSFSFSSDFRSREQRHIGVHVLSEFVFCPRAALIAFGTGRDNGDEEPDLGPRLDLFIDYSEQQLIDELNKEWSSLVRWMFLMIPAVSVVALAHHFHSWAAAVVVSLPVLILADLSWQSITKIYALLREWARLRKAPEVVIDLEGSEIRSLDWWSLRKAGFDCQKLKDGYQHPDRNLVGKPWRQLRKGGNLIPVIRRRCGNSDWGRQHEVRIAAYCDLIQRCTTANAPFGVILFAGTNKCVLVPSTASRHAIYEREFQCVREFIGTDVNRTPGTNPPTDSRCRGCPHGKPRKLQPGKSDTVLNGKRISPCPAKSVNEERKHTGTFHSTCGDKFRWTPPHKDAVAKGIAEEYREWDA
jgi:hypothetical protein